MVTVCMNVSFMFYVINTVTFRVLLGDPLLVCVCVWGGSEQLLCQLMPRAGSGNKGELNMPKL